MTSLEQVVDWLEGRLSPAEAERVAVAVEGDAELTSMVAWLRRFHAATADVVLERPPARVHDLLVQRFAAYRPAPPSALRRLQAAVIFDTAWSSAVGVRAGVAAAGQRHVVLETEPLDVALDIYQDDTAWRVEGQLLPPGTGEVLDAEVRLLAGDAVVATVVADPTGMFALAAVPAGGYVLQVRWDGLVVDSDLDLP